MTPDRCVVRVDADHACLVGHFPGNPVVPGVVVLAQIAAAVAQSTPPVRVIGIPRAKFLLPLQPGQDLVVALTDQPAGTIGFEGRVGTVTCVRGELQVEPAEPAA